MDRVDLAILNRLKRTGLPVRYWLYAVKGRRAMARPGRVAAHRRLGRALLAAAGPPAPRIDPDDRFLRFGPDLLPGTVAVVATCRALADGRAAAVRAGMGKKPFLHNVLTRPDVERHPHLMDFALSDTMLALVTDYLGTLPVLRMASLFFSDVNDTTVSSQKFHFDGDDARQIKVFVNVVDVDDGNGPFTFLPGRASRRVCERERMDWPYGRAEDEQVLAGAGGTAPVAATGPAGSGVMLDTTNCLHFGSRSRHRARVVLTLQYTTPATFKIDKGKFDLTGMPLMDFPQDRFAADPVRRAVLERGR